MLNFVSAMFYGASKNKNGKEISDYDKYKPWSAEEFSGKIVYTLDSDEQFEVFRDFSKKNPKIYNKNLEDISNNFNVDKTKGNQFFIEQTGIDENLFFNTMTICQEEVVLDSVKQNNLIQKITNVVSSGDDNISYKKTMDKLSKKLIDEVGTARTSERPINIVEEEIKNIELDKNNLELCKIEVQNIDTEKSVIKNNLEITQKELDILNEIKEYKQSELLEEQKIGIAINKLNEYKNKLNTVGNKNYIVTNSKIKILNPFILLIILIIITGISALLKNAVFTTVIGIISSITFLFNFYKYNKKQKEIAKQREDNIRQNKEIEMIEESIKQCDNEIALNREKIEKKQNEEKSNLIKKFGNSVLIDDYMLEETTKISQEINKKQKEYNEIMLKENALSIKKDNMYVKLEGLVNKAEKLQYLYEQQLELKKLANSIKYAQEGLEEAYAIVKSTVTPKFTGELTKIIKKVTSDKYDNVQFNDNDGLIVELKNGEYTKCDRLSIGTIDQMYLALRLAILNEISKETMPIILDEAFVYYDKNRLENILKYISTEYDNRQVIILTCTDREVEALNNLGVQYNLIDLF